MAKGIIIAGRRVRLRFFFFIAITLTFILFVSKLSLKQPLYDIIQYGEITSWNECAGLVIRQEKTYTAPDYGKVDFFVSKGQIVEKDALLAVLYRDNFDQGLIDDLYETKQKISDYQNKNLVQEIMDSDFEKIHDNISQIMRTMQYSVHDGVVQGMAEYENQLRGLLSRRKEMLDKEDFTNSYLEQLYEQEKDIEDKLDEWKVEIAAPETGMISFELDGLEDLLTLNEIDYLNAEQYLSFKEHETVDSNNENSVLDAPLFKIVSPDRWYIASLIPHRNIFYEQGDSVSVKLLGLSEDIIESRIYKVDSLKDSTLVILEMTEGIESVLEARNIHIEIGTVTHGLMVPKSAIINRKDEAGVKVVHNGDIEYVKVKVRAMDDKWAVVEKENDADILELNDSILVN